MEDVKFWKNELTKLQEKYALLEKHLSEVEIKYQLALADQGGDNHGEHSRRLFKTVAGLYGKPLYSDITILLDGERTIHGHKLVLSTCFDEWCGTNLNDVDIIDLSDLDSSTAVTMIKWIYTDIFETKDVDAYFLEELLKAAVKYKLDNLNERCQEALVYFVDQTNCRRFYQTADKMSASILKDHCSKFLPQTELKELQYDNNEELGCDNLVLIDDKINPHKCHLCPWRFENEEKLKAHIERHKKRKPYPCNFCDKSFHKPCEQKRHMRIHSGEKPFKCGICEKSFGTKCYMETHRKSHEGKFEYPCDLCDKAFNNKRNLTVHRRGIHAGLQPYKCGLCEKSYAQKGNLKVHIQSHARSKQCPAKKGKFTCDLCNKTLSYHYRASHMRTHTGHRPYQCQLCDKAFVQSNTLKKHCESHNRTAENVKKKT